MLLNSKQNSASNSEAQGGIITTPVPGRPARGTTTGRPLPVLFDLIGRRWALSVLWALRDDTLGFRAIQRECDQLSSSVLRDRLRELGEAGLVETGEDGQYRLTTLGRELRGILEPLVPWGERWEEQFRACPRGQT